MSKFVISKGGSNEFIITIKQNGTTLPMVIVTNANTFTERFSPKTSSIPYRPYSPAVEARAEVLAQPYIAPTAKVEGKVEIVNIRVTNGYATDDVVYSIHIEGTSIATTYDSTIHGSVYKLFTAVAGSINGNATINTKVVATVDNNVLVLTGKTVGKNYLINTSDNLTVIEQQQASPIVSATPGQAAVVYSPAVSAVSEVLEKLAYFKYTGEPSVIDVTSFVEVSKISNVKVSFSREVYSVVAGENPVVAVDGKYDLGLNTIFSVVELPADTEVPSLPDSIKAYVEITTNDYEDSFSSSLFLASTGEKVFDVPVNVYDANNGRIKLSISAIQADSLLLAVGDRADYYYIKPSYKLLINCNTANNGKFVAKVNKVYVE